MELGRPNRSVQEAHKPLQSRHLDRRQPNRELKGSGNSAGLYTAAAVAT